MTRDSGDTASEADVRRIGEEKLDVRGRRKRPARRWVVERTISWLNRCRAILIRWDKKTENYQHDGGIQPPAG